MGNNKNTNPPQQKADAPAETDQVLATVQALPKVRLWTKARNWFSDHPRITGVMIGAAASPVLLHFASKTAGQNQNDEIEDLLNGVDNTLNPVENDVQS